MRTCMESAWPGKSRLQKLTGRLEVLPRAGTSACAERITGLAPERIPSRRILRAVEFFVGAGVYVDGNEYVGFFAVGQTWYFDVDIG